MREAPAVPVASKGLQGRPSASHGGTAAALVALAATLSLACGRPATEADCTKVVEKSVELELKAKNRSPEEIAKQKTETLEKFRDKIKECIGKRVSDHMLACVDKSASVADMNGCMK